MHSITLKSAEIKTSAVNTTLDYKKELLRLSETPAPGQSFSVAQMRKAIRVTEKLEAANGHVVLEDADWEFLNQRVQAEQWGLAHKAIVQFVSDVENAPTEPPTEPPTERNGELTPA